MVNYTNRTKNIHVCHSSTGVLVERRKRNGFYELLGHLIDARNRFHFSFDEELPRD